MHNCFPGLFGWWVLPGLWLSSQLCSAQRNSIRSYLWKARAEGRCWGFWSSLLETFQQAPFLSLGMSKHFSKGISTPGIPHQKYPLNNVSLVPDLNDVGVLVHFYSVNTPLSWQCKLVFWSSVSGKTDGPATSVLYLSGPFTQGHNTSPVVEECLDTVLQHS